MLTDSIGSIRSTSLAPAPPLLEVSNLSVSLVKASLTPPVLNQINLRLHAQEILGVFGESGAGKSTLAMALSGLLPKSEWKLEGTISVSDLRRDNSSDHRHVRVALIHQDSGVLNPVIRVGQQIVEVLRARGAGSWATCRELSKNQLTGVGFNDSEAVYLKYPHELSGGEQQRVVIARALASDPAILIADEPTASLDQNTAREIAALLFRLAKKESLGLIFICHDLEVLATVSDRIMVVYAGEVVETGSTVQVIGTPAHPYTRALLRSVLLPEKLTGTVRTTTLPFIPGRVDTSIERNTRCVFENRCDDRMMRCSMARPSVESVAPSHDVSCFRFEA